MAEKHMAEAGWKTLVVKHKVKDKELSKALGAYEKLGPAGDLAARMAAADEVAAVAAKLKKNKEIAAVPDLLDYVGEVAKECVKSKQALALLKTSADKKAAPKAPETKTPAPKETEQSEGEAEDEGDLGARLASGLKRVRSADGETALQFVACIAKPVWGVMVATRVGKPHRDELMAATGGKKFLSGTCVFEESKWTFVVPSVSGGLAAQLQKGIKAQTGKSFAVRVRDEKGTVLDADSDREVDGPIAGEEAADETESEQRATREPSPADMKALDAQIKAVIEGIKRAAALGRPDIAALLKDATLRASEAGVLLRKGDGDSAAPIISMAEDALRRALELAQGPAPSQKSAPQTPPKTGKKVDYTKARLAWDSARKKVRAQIDLLKGAIRDECGDLPEFPQIDAALAKYDRILANLDEQLIDSLDAALNAPDDTVAAPHKAKALEHVRRYEKFVQKDGVVQTIDANPFHPVAVCATLEATLKALDAALAG
jgi:hypothetical protein